MKYRILAETITTEKYLNVDELEKKLEFYFNLWQDEKREQQLFFDNDVSKMRMEILNKKITIEEEMISIQDKAKEKHYAIKQKKWVNLDELRSLEIDIKYKALEIRKLQNKLSVIKDLEKSRNIEKATNEDRAIFKELINIIPNYMNKETATKMINEALIEAGIERVFSFKY